MNASVLAKVIRQRWWLSYYYFLITLLVCVLAAFNSSFIVGAAALVACALCYFGTARFTKSVYARRDKNYDLKELVGLAAIAAVLSVAGIIIMAWSGLWLRLYSITVDGPVWCLIGILVALLATTREPALQGQPAS